MAVGFLFFLTVIILVVVMLLLFKYLCEIWCDNSEVDKENIRPYRNTSSAISSVKVYQPRIQSSRQYHNAPVRYHSSNYRNNFHPPPSGFRLNDDQTFLSETAAMNVPVIPVIDWQTDILNVDLPDTVIHQDGYQVSTILINEECPPADENSKEYCCSSSSIDKKCYDESSKSDYPYAGSGSDHNLDDYGSSCRCDTEDYNNYNYSSTSDSYNYTSTVDYSSESHQDWGQTDNNDYNDYSCDTGYGDE